MSIERALWLGGEEVLVRNVFCLWVAIAIAATSAAAKPNLADESRVMELQRAWQKAYVDGEDAALSPLVSDDFILTNSAGEILDRTTAVSHYGSDREEVEIAFEDQRVQLYGDTAVATVKVRETHGRRQQLMRATDTFVRQKGEWRVVASHWTRLPPEVVEAKLDLPALERFAGEYRGPGGGLLKVVLREDRFEVIAPNSPPVEFVATSDRLLVARTGQVRWLFIGEPGRPFSHVVVQNQNGLVALKRAP